MTLRACSPEIYKHNKEERIARTWGCTAPGLPYVDEHIAASGNWLIGGDLEVLQKVKYNDGLDHYRYVGQRECQESSSGLQNTSVTSSAALPLSVIVGTIENWLPLQSSREQ